MIELPPSESQALLSRVPDALSSYLTSEHVIGMVGWVIAFIIGFLTSMIAEPLKRWYFRPRMKVEFQSTEAFVARTPEAYQKRAIVPGVGSVVIEEKRHDSVWIRVRVSNQRTWRGSLASKCRAYLVKVERQSASGRFEDARFFDPAQLAWASRKDPEHPGKEFEPRDLPKGMFHYVDVFSTRETEPDSVKIAAEAVPFRERIGEVKGRYRFTIAVAGDNFDPVEFPLTFTLTGKWDDIRFD